MYTKGHKKGTVRFAFKPGNGARKIQMAGDFNNWQPARMRKQKDGSFVAVVPLPAGNYEYKFLVDGQWVLDGDNSSWAVNPYGTMNSVVHAE